jgi:hypothetical protein
VKVLDPGHQFRLDSLDGDAEVILTFVKRDNPPEKYPGNIGHHPGTTLQEVLRAMLSRLHHLTAALYLLERRAHEAHGARLLASREAVAAAVPCSHCGHVFCHWCAA